MEAKSITRAGVIVALLAVSAQVMVPVGPVPFTLQTLVLAMAQALPHRASSTFAVVAYVALGALGLPVFSGFAGGLGVLAGPTGGFLWGFVLGSALTHLLDRVLPQGIAAYPRALILALVLLLVSYACGTAQLMMLMSLDVARALVIAVIPFAIPDAVKLAVGARMGLLVGRVTK